MFYRFKIRYMVERIKVYGNGFSLRLQIQCEASVYVKVQGEAQFTGASPRLPGGMRRAPRRGPRVSPPCHKTRQMMWKAGAPSDNC